MTVIMEIHQKILTPRIPPFKVTQGHWNWQGLISCLWRTICITYW